MLLGIFTRLRWNPAHTSCLPKRCIIHYNMASNRDIWEQHYRSIKLLPSRDAKLNVEMSHSYTHVYHLRSAKGPGWICRWKSQLESLLPTLPLGLPPLDSKCLTTCWCGAIRKSWVPSVVQALPWRVGPEATPLGFDNSLPFLNIPILSS